MKTSELLRKSFDYQNSSNEKQREVLIELGVCPDCLKPCCHDVVEPFSSCNCGTGEDYMDRPLQLLQAVKHYYTVGKEVPENIKEKIKELGI